MPQQSIEIHQLLAIEYAGYYLTTLSPNMPEDKKIGEMVKTYERVLRQLNSYPPT